MTDRNLQFEAAQARRDEAVADVKDLGARFIQRIDAVATPRSARMGALARTKVEEAVMWAVKAIQD